MSRTEFLERRKRITDEIYTRLKMQHRDVFDQCVAMGVVTQDSIERGLDPLKIAAEVERSAVLLAACALGIAPGSRRQ